MGAFIHSRADRYTYLSQIGLTIALAWGVWRVYQSRQTRQAVDWRGWTLAVVSGAAILLLAAVAWRQTTYWRNAETLWTRAATSTEQNLLGHFNLAHLYIKRGKTDEAIVHLREVVAFHSLYREMIAYAHDLLAEQLIDQGKTDEGFAHLHQAVRLFPTGVAGHCRLAIALAHAGRHDQAIAEWRETVRLVPASLEARLGLANALLAGGDPGEAIAQCSEVLKMEPGSIEAVVILGAALAADGRADEALPHLNRALELQPGNARAHVHLGLVLFDLGRSRNALAHLNQAVRLQPDDVPTLWQTAWILATCPDPSIRDGARAVELATRAIQLSGGQEVRTFDALAAALAETENFSSAVEVAEQASTMALACRDAHWPTPLGSGRDSTAGAWRIASRRSLCRPSARRRPRLSKCLRRRAQFFAACFAAKTDRIIDGRRLCWYAAMW